MAMPDPMAETMPMDPAMGGNPDNPNNLDENTVNEAMMAAAQDFGNIDDADDYEGMINSIRGDKAPMAERVNELAGMVGLEDAQQTPESVVALLQPVMLLNSMDQGIGSIAEGVMDTEMSGDMTGGIMSTVNMEPPMEPAMAQPMPMDPGMGMPMGMEAGNEPPVNFRFGGPVARMQEGGEPVEESRLSQLFAEQQGVLNDNFGRAPVDPMDLEREREMNQAQMLFDVAGTALAFATPGSTQMSPAQRLAEAATETKLFDKIGARAQGQLSADQARKNSMRDEKMKMDLLALGSAETMTTAQAKARADAAAKVGTPINMSLRGDPSSAVSVVKGSPQEAQLRNKGYLVTGSVSLSDSDAANAAVNYINLKTNDFRTVRKNSPAEDELIADPDFSLTGPKSQSADSTFKAGFVNFESPSGERVTVRTDDLDTIDDLLEDDYTQITTASSTTARPSARIRFITDADRLAAYAEGTLDQSETAQFEQMVIEMQIPSQETVNGTTISRPAMPLSRSVLDAIQARKNLGIPTADFKIPDIQTSVPAALADIRKQPDNASRITAFEQYRNRNTGVLPRNLLNSPEFSGTLLDEAGATDLSSPSWKMVPTQIFNPTVNYDAARGVGTVYDRASAYIGEVVRDVSGSGRVSAAGEMTYQADNDFKALKLQTLGVLANAVTDDRVLKTVQDQINDVLSPLEPGVFKFDAKANAAIKSIGSQLSMLFDRQAVILPEYGGNPRNYSDKQIRDARQTASQLRGLLAEYVQFGTAMDNFLDGSQGSGGSTLGQTDLQRQKNTLYEMARKNQGGR